MANNLPLLTHVRSTISLTGTTSVGILTEFYNWFNAGNSTHWEVDEYWSTGGDIMFTLQPKNQSGNVPNLRIGYFSTSNSTTNPNSLNTLGTANDLYAYCFCAPDGSAGYDNDPISGEIYTSADWTKSATFMSSSSLSAVDVGYIIENEEYVAINVVDSDQQESYSAICGAAGHKSDGNSRRYLACGSGIVAMNSSWGSSVSQTASPITAYNGSSATTSGMIGAVFDELDVNGALCYRSTVFSTDDSRSSDLTNNVMVPIPIYSSTEQAFCCTLRQMYMGPKALSGAVNTKEGVVNGYGLSAGGATYTTNVDTLWFLNE